MILFMAYHFGVHSFTGAWIGINYFFVLSAYLLASLALREKSRTGRIDFLGFYKRRVRRLAPALILLLGVVVAYSLKFHTLPDRKMTGGDVLASQAFVINWRLIARSDDYFGDLRSPSLLRHLWTLSVEEQFYLIIPLLMTLLIATRSRRWAITICLAVAGVSAWRSAAVGVATVEEQTRNYYGTDTRMQAFAIGVALAIWATLGDDRSIGISRRGIRLIGVIGLIVTVYGFSPSSR